MEGQEAVQGVTGQEGVEAPDSVPEESQTSEQGEMQETEKSASSEDEVLPWGKHPRWIKQLNANRELKTQLKQFQEQAKTYEQLSQFDKWLEANPAKRDQILRIIQAQEDVENAEDPYAGYSPEVAERFRKLDAIERKLQEREMSEQQREQSALQTHQNTIDESYREFLIKDGFLNSDGKPTDPLQTYAMDILTKNFLDNIAKDPNRPSLQEMKEAYKNSQEAFKKFGNRALRNAVKTTNIPSSGSKSGTAYSPKGNRALTVDEMVSMLS